MKKNRKYDLEFLIFILEKFANNKNFFKSTDFNIQNFECKKIVWNAGDVKNEAIFIQLGWLGWTIDVFHIELP